MSFTAPTPSVVRSTSGSWRTTTCPSRVRWTSNSTISAPISSADAKDASVFSGRRKESPRWAMTSGGTKRLSGELGFGAGAGQRLLVDLGVDEDLQHVLVELAAV